MVEAAARGRPRQHDEPYRHSARRTATLTFQTQVQHRGLRLGRLVTTPMSTWTTAPAGRRSRKHHQAGRGQRDRRAAPPPGRTQRSHLPPTRASRSVCGCATRPTVRRRGLNNRRRSAGIFLDAISLDAGGTNLFKDGAETGSNGWTSPASPRGLEASQTNAYDHYYVASNRKYASYDRYLRAGRTTSDQHGGEPDYVKHFPYQNGLLVSYWDTSHSENNTSDSSW